MYENIYGIKFFGAAFESETKLNFFDKAKERMCLIYGKNGSGKSTISRAIQKASGIDVKEIMSSEFIDLNGNELLININNGLPRIFVFNEEYVQNNVRLKEDGLDTIVLFGKKANLENKITNAQKEYDDLNALYLEQVEECKKFMDESSILSPSYYLSKMKSKLQGEGHWADRERIIIGAKTNSSVRENTYKNIIVNVPLINENEIWTKYEEQLKVMKLAKDDSARITNKVNSDISLRIKENEILDLLSMKIEKPELSEREEYLLSLVEKGNIETLKNIQKTFEKEHTDTCPYCLQPVSKEYKKELIISIQKVLNRKVENHKAALESVLIQEIELNFDVFLVLDKSIVDKCRQLLNELNSEIRRSNSLIKRKVEKLFTPITGESLSLNVKLTNLIAELKVLDEARIHYNATFDDTDKIKKELQKLNRNIAYYEIKDAYDVFEKQKKEKEEQDKKSKTLLESFNNKRKTLDELIQQKKNVKIAVNIINNSLRYVFFSNNRLEIHVDNELYALRSNGKPVKPANISVGERNIIALCYFFAELLNNQNAENGYTEEMMVVIDDPVSSFDIENRVGIMSFIKAQILHVICDNEKSKVIIFTHDLQSFFDLNKIMDEVRNAANEKYSKKSSEFRMLELTNKSLIQFQFLKRHEYTELLKIIYEYANGNATEYDLVIGNVMRRTLEAFSTFEYKKGIDTISCDEEILSLLGNQTYYSYFQNLMYRLVLNGESHMVDRVRSSMEVDFSTFLTADQKKKTSKDVLCLIYCLNHSHIKAHLGDVAGALNNIDGWCQNILTLGQPTAVGEN